METTASTFCDQYASAKKWKRLFTRSREAAEEQEQGEEGSDQEKGSKGDNNDNDNDNETPGPPTSLFPSLMPRTNRGLRIMVRLLLCDPSRTLQSAPLHSVPSTIST